MHQEYGVSLDLSNTLCDNVIHTMWFFFAIATALLWGVSMAMFKKTYAHLSPILSVIAGAIGVLVTLVPFSLFNGAELIFWPLVPIATIASGLYIFYFYALEKGKLSLTSSVQSTYPAYTVALAILFLHEPIRLQSLFGTLFLLAGVFLLSVEDSKSLKKLTIGPWLWWGGIAGLFAGIGDFFAKVIVMRYSVYSYILAFAIGWIIMTGILSLFQMKQIKLKGITKAGKWLFFAEATLFIGYIFFYLAFEQGPVTVVAPITALYSAVSVFCGIFWLKEKIARYQWYGIILCAIGAVLVSI